MSKSKNSKTDSDSNGASWGQASDKRGIANMPLAKDFIKRFHCGTELTTTELDEWLEAQGLLTPSPDGKPASTQGRAFLSHRGRERSVVLGRLKRGGSHPRMWSKTTSPFSLESIGRNLWRVRAPEEAVVLKDLARVILALAKTLHRHTKYLLQSIDQNQFSEWENGAFEMVYDDDEFVVNQVRQLADRKRRKLKELIDKAKNRRGRPDLPELFKVMDSEFSNGVKNDQKTH